MEVVARPGGGRRSAAHAAVLKETDDQNKHKNKSAITRNDAIVRPICNNKNIKERVSNGKTNKESDQALG
jgi:hypothetical protein